MRPFLPTNPFNFNDRCDPLGNRVGFDIPGDSVGFDALGSRHFGIVNWF